MAKSSGSIMSDVTYQPMDPEAVEEDEYFGPIHLWHPEVGWVSDEPSPERKRAMLRAMEAKP